jgi:gliding motility-associated-like protein
MNYTLDVKISSTFTLNSSICEGESYEFFDENISESGIYSKVLNNSIGCDSIIYLNLKVFEKPLVLLPDTQSTIRGQKLKIEILAFENYIYNWSTNDTTRIIEIYPETSEYYFVTVSNEYCNVTKNIFVDVFDAASLELLIYEVITPNNDGLNDYLYINNLELFPNNKIQIFNRNGHLLYEKENFSNNDKWDGMYKGNKLPEASYYVLFFPEITKSTFIRKTISILR